MGDRDGSQERRLSAADRARHQRHRVFAMERQVVHNHRAAEIVPAKEQERNVAQIYKVRRAAAGARIAERYVVFLYEGYDYQEITLEGDFLKEKTSLFILPDFIIGNNPVKSNIQYQMEKKQIATMTKEYLYCHNCLVQDYDSIQGGINSAKECPICGSKNVEVIYPDSIK